MTSDIRDVLKKIDVKDTGRYENHFYIIDLADSNEYAKMYTKLDKNAINTEYPEFTKNTNNSTVKVVNYFELDKIKYIIATHEGSFSTVSTVDEIIK